MAITQVQIEQNVKDLITNYSQDTFIFDLLLAYGEPKATISRLKKGDLNQLESKGELTHRKKLFFKVIHISNSDIHHDMDKVKIDIDKLKQKPRFIILTDFKSFLCFDTKNSETLDIRIDELPKHYTFLLPLNKIFDVDKIIDENPADVRASHKLAKLYDEILINNPTSTHDEVHALNVFLTRLLFCYFAEDSNIFKQNIFTNSISAHTADDGSDLNSYLERLFDIFNTHENNRADDIPEFLKAFPYVNGGLFKDKIPLPHFTTKSRNILLEIGGLDWAEINPDIFGSMIQAVVTPEHRGDMGMHYTSVPNIMKVIKPLFLDELYEEFLKAKGNTRKLNLLHLRLQNLKIFDPACGSGNFLIIAYKEIRKLEMLIFKEGGLLISPSIALTQFYGIELDDFAHEVAILSLWLTEHQMNVAFKKEFGSVPPTLPLQDGGNIVHGNATRLDWEVVCPKIDGDEIYILGNPPYLGARYQEETHREDLEFVLREVKGYKRLDYIACWFYKGANYIDGFNIKFAFVTTNSINQGEQVVTFWSQILKENIEIDFAHTSFKWQNNAKANAGVTVTIIGLRNKSDKPKYIFQSELKEKVKNINAYLVNADDIFIQKRSKPISNLVNIGSGNRALDDGYLLLSDSEKNELLSSYPEAAKLIKSVVGAAEFLRAINKWCLWIYDEDLDLAMSIPPIKARIEKVKEYRLKRKNTSTKNPADTPHQFLKMKMAKNSVLFLPTVSSERRKYIPCGFLDKDTVIIDPNFAIYDPEPFIFGIISSHLHMIWMKMVSGKLETRYRYSSTLVYNNFPFPSITDKQKEKITELVFNIIEAREDESDKTLAQLYDPDKMPLELKEAHHQLDLAIEKCYRSKPFKNDEERLEYLFRLYEEMVTKEKSIAK